MSAITTILTAAAATVGAAAVIRHVKKRVSTFEEILKQAKDRAQGKVDEEVIEFEKNPETGSFQAKDLPKT